MMVDEQARTATRQYAAECFALAPDQLLKRDRTSDVLHARWVWWQLLYQGGMGVTEIAALCEVHYSSVIYGQSKLRGCPTLVALAAQYDPRDAWVRGFRPVAGGCYRTAVLRYVRAVLHGSRIPLVALNGLRALAAQPALRQQLAEALAPSGRDHYLSVIREHARQAGYSWTEAGQ